MEPKKNNRKRKRRTGLILTLVLPLVLLSACYVFVFHINGFSVDMTLHGEEQITVRYGDSFDDPGCEASFSGNYLLSEDMPLQVTCEGHVDEEKVGVYELVYRAEYGFWSAEVKRTVKVVDRVRPKILLLGSPGTYVLPGEEYEEEGFYACDNYDGNLTDQVVTQRIRGQIIYTVTDSSGNSAQAVRSIAYYDPVHPELVLEGDREITLTAGTKFEEPGYSAFDNMEGDLTDQVLVSGNLNIYQQGSYNLTYSVTDSYGNKTTASRIIRVEGVAQPEIVEPSGKVIYLTFDDGPGPYTRQLLDVLKKYNVKATFFVINTDYLYLVKDMVKEGHSVGIHSVSHDYHEIYASEEAYFADLLQMQQLIEDECGIRTSLVRFPGGGSNTVSRFNKGIMTRLAQALDDTGFQYFDWNVDSDDAGKAREKEEVFENVMEGLQEHRISIVLQHDIKDYSVEAVEKIIVWALNNGYRFLPLDPTSPNAHHDIQN